jgi:hypothetical protein
MNQHLDHVNFQLLLKQHGGNFERAKQAWDAICQLGHYGNVPHTYDGGLDIKGIRLRLEEEGRRASAIWASGDDVKRIEDIAAGDDPAKIR